MHGRSCWSESSQEKKSFLEFIHLELKQLFIGYMKLIGNKFLCLNCEHFLIFIIFLLCDIKRIIFWFIMFFLRLKFILKKSFLFFGNLCRTFELFSHILIHRLIVKLIDELMKIVFAASVLLHISCTTNTMQRLETLNAKYSTLYTYN